jgi:hypothetical protein
MARLLHLEAAYRNLGDDARYTSDLRCQERSGCDTSGNIELLRGSQFANAAQEGSQVIQRSAQPFPHDRTSNAAGS